MEAGHSATSALMVGINAVNKPLSECTQRTQCKTEQNGNHECSHFTQVIEVVHRVTDR